MKSTQLTHVLLAVSLASAAFASPVSKPDRSVALQPTPIVVVEPSGLPRSFPGGIVQVEFALDDSGRPCDIRLSSVYDGRVNQEVLKAFSQWQFAPAKTAAADQPKRFLLPLEVKPQ